MHTPLKTLLAASALIAGIAAAPALYAQSVGDAPTSQIPSMGPGGMMGPGNTMGQGNRMGPGNMPGPGGAMGPGNMTGPGGKMPVAQMMQMMGRMMETHGKMMQAMLDAHGVAQPDESDDK